ncbi:NADP-dependent oxidoreductase domain-containing protein [Aspergillus alliaceus]|nr:NADP-dependent oxidoreductase domain-containing protein [Aspergillus alliaceus]KAB8238033.1 NADP-dependent oxidoreductase domain-containing protein [Aspergillus alliaceus]
MEYNPFCLNIEPPKHQLLDTAQELGVAVISYSPLGNRLLSGTFQSKDDFTKPGDIRGSVPWFSDDNFQTNLSILDKIGEIARSKGVTAAQSTLAWILSQEGDFFVMPSTTKAHRVAETLGSLEITVTPEEKAISQAL